MKIPPCGIGALYRMTIRNANKYKEKPAHYDTGPPLAGLLLFPLLFLRLTDNLFSRLKRKVGESERCVGPSFSCIRTEIVFERVKRRISKPRDATTIILAHFLLLSV
jgi:hypothetical protein